MRYRNRQSSIPFLALALAAAQPLQAQGISIDDNVTWSEAAQAPLVPDSIDLTTITSVSGSDNLVIPLNRVEFALDPSSIERRHVRIYRFQTAEAIRDFGNVQIYFDAATDAITVDTAVVIDASGNVHTIEPATVQILSSDTVNIFGDGKVAVVPLAGLEIGATAIVAHTVVSDRTNDIGPWGYVTRQQFGVPQERLEIAVSWPAPELRPVWHSQLEDMTCTEQSPLSVSCVAFDVPAYPVDENAYYDDVTPQFVVAEERAWEDISSWYAPLFQSALSADETIAAMAEQLVAGLETQTEMLRAIHRFVAEDIRYVAFEHGDSAYVPHATSMTLARRYGDCKDKAALLVDLLSHAGIDLVPVLVATSRREPDGMVIPTRAYFDHLIVCGALSNGVDYCLDATDPYTGIDSLSSWIQGAASLPVVADATLSNLPQEEFGWIIHEDVEYELGLQGQLTERSGVDYLGAYGASMRANLASMNSGELQDWAIDDYHGAVSDLVTPEFAFSGIEDINGGVTISWEVEYEDLLDPEQDLYYAELMPWLNQALRFLETENDTYSYRFPGLEFDSTITLPEPARWRIEDVGPDIDMQTRFGEFTRSYERQGQDVKVRTRFVAPVAEIEVEDIEYFNRFLEIVREEGLLHATGRLR